MADAVRVASLHVGSPGWADAGLKFIESGGFSVSGKIKNIFSETLVIWGRQDKILDPKLYAQRSAGFSSDLAISSPLHLSRGPPAWPVGAGESCVRPRKRQRKPVRRVANRIERRADGASSSRSIHEARPQSS